jgi:uncharacterized membrane protein YeiB
VVLFPAEKYIAFAKPRFSNATMLEFLSGQFEDDAGYVTTRKGLMTRPMGIFGSTLMQTLFRGKRTVRFESLLPDWARRQPWTFSLCSSASGTLSGHTPMRRAS